MSRTPVGFISIVVVVTKITTFFYNCGHVRLDACCGDVTSGNGSVGRLAYNNRLAGPANELAPACRWLISAGWRCIVLCVSQIQYRPHWPILSLVSAVISVEHPASHRTTLLALEFSDVQSSHHIKLKGRYSLLNINSFHSPTNFSRPANLTTYIIYVELAPHLLSP